MGRIGRAQQEMHGGNCYICGMAEGTSVEHVEPLGPGEDTMENCRLACKGCNSSKLRFDLREFLRRRELEGLPIAPEAYAVAAELCLTHLS